MTKWLLSVVLMLLPVAVFGEGRFPSDWDETTGIDWCNEFIADRDHDLLMYGCFLDFARRERVHEKVIDYFDAHLVEAPEDHAARLTLGRLLADQTDNRALDEYAVALEGFIAEENLPGQVYTRIMIAYFHQWYQRWEESQAELQAAESAARASGDPLLLCRVLMRQGLLAYFREDYSLSWIKMKQAEQLAFPDGPVDIKVPVLDSLGSVSHALGKYREALDYFRRQAALLGDEGLHAWAAFVRFRIAETAERVRVPRRFSHDEQIEFTRSALEAALEAGDTSHESSSRVLLGSYLDPEPALKQFEIALKLARADQNDRAERFALRAMALGWLDMSPPDPERAFRLIEEAIANARSRGNIEDEIRGYSVRANMRWRCGPVESAIEDSLLMLEQIERKRELQHDDLVRARTFARFAHSYRRFADRVLASATAAPSARDIDLALQIMERMRSRVLLDSLDAANITSSIVAESPAHRTRQELLSAIAAVQKQLIQPKLPTQDRRQLLDELERLEVEEAAARDELIRANPAFAALYRPSFPSLRELQETLDEHQAILAYQIETDQIDLNRLGRVDSWVILVTRSHASAHRIPEGEYLERDIPLFLGLLNRRDGSGLTGGAILHSRLLKEALARLPAGVDQLVIIPDGPLFRLPFGALRAGPSACPLAGRYSINMVPSATLWRRWRTGGKAERPLAVLAVADPAFAMKRENGVFRSAGVFRADMELGPLPRARDEALSVFRSFGRDGRVLIGADASERQLKSLDMGRFRILHLATHAVIDDDKPHRSAVVLAPGADDEDGLLQPREIVELDLGGGVVILSACSSAAGTLLEGEGVMGLARSFFQAGANAVLGSLWPLRDDEASLLMSGMARHLARGKSLGEALALTQRKWYEDGRPAASWAGVVLLGDGDIVPFPNGIEEHRPAGNIPLVIGLGLLALVSVFVFWRRFHRLA